MPFERPARARRRVSLTALIDVVFLLLVFFMLGSRFFDYGAISLEAQAVAVGSERADERVVRVDLHDDGRIDVAGEPVDRASVAEAVRERLGEHGRTAVIVAPDDDVPVEWLVGALDAVRRSGADAITLGRRSARPES